MPRIRDSVKGSPQPKPDNRLDFTLWQCWDKEFNDESSLGGDYEWIELWLGDQLLTTFGDSYHDSGQEKAYGFAEGYAKALGRDYYIYHKEKLSEPLD